MYSTLRPRPFVQGFLCICCEVVPNRQQPSLLSPSHQAVQHFVLAVLQPAALFRLWVAVASLSSWAGNFHKALSRAWWGTSCLPSCSIPFLNKISTYVSVTDLHWTCWNKTSYCYVVHQVTVKLMSAVRAFLVCTNKFLSWRHYLPDFADKLHVRVDLM